MKRTTKRTPQQEQDTRFALIFILTGVVLMLAVALFGIEYSRKEAQRTMNRNIRDLKKQVNEYNEFLAADEVKSLVRLTEQAESFSETLAMLDEDRWQEYLENSFTSHRLSCILVLDENLEMDGSLSPAGKNGAAEACYEMWKTELQGSIARSVLEHPKKLYSSRIQHGESGIYDIAVVARTDQAGIVFCAALQDDENLELNYSPVKNLLARNETKLNGTLCIAENGRIIATNQEKTYTSIEEIPQILALEEQNAGSTLTRVVSNGSVYYGGIVKSRNYDIYAVYPASAVYSSCRIILQVAFILYLLIAFVINMLHFKAREDRARETRRQYETIKAVSQVYSFAALIDLKSGRYELLKYPPEWGDIANAGESDAQFYERMIDNAGAQFRPDYRAFLDRDTLNERLSDHEYTEYEYQNSAGEWLDDSLVVHERGADGGVNSVVLVRKSINEQKKTELEYQAKLITAIQNEQKANQSKTDFLRRISHDVRTPINVILGMLEMGGRHPDDTKLLESCRIKAQTAAEYLLELVNDILTLNKADDENGGVQTAEVFRVQEEVQKLYLIAAEQVKDYDGVTLEPPQLTGEDRPLLGEPLYLRQIMMNIINNAMRYSKKGGSVRFSVSQTPAQDRDGYAEVRFVCADDGIGMSKAFQKTMFEPFAQESAVSVSRFDGVGLGLSIVQKLVNRLNGTIAVESEQGRGTRFEITIPYPYAEPSAAPETPAAESVSLDGLTVLIAEDNELNMEIAEFMAEEAGMKVVKASDGGQAVEKFAASAVGEIDLILTDVIMPEMDGLEETRRIRALDRPDAKTVPIIAMTANLFEEDIREYTAAGMTGVLPKPLNIVQLTETVTKQITKGGKNNG